MELIVCFFLASLITGFRPVSDMVHLMRGQEPPHLAKARLRAENEKLRLAVKQAKAENRAPRPADGKPTLGDVARVYWGDALADVIAAHDRKRAEKQAQQTENQNAATEQRPARQVRPSWRQRAARLMKMLIRPVGDNTPPPETEPAVEPATSDTRQTYRWSCGECGLHGPDQDREEDAEAAWNLHNQQVHGGQGTLTPTDPAPIPDHADENLKPAPRHGIRWTCDYCHEQSTDQFPDLTTATDSYFLQHPQCPAAGYTARTRSGRVQIGCADCDFRSDAIYPTRADAWKALEQHRLHECPHRHIEPHEGDDMTTTTTGATATGDAYDLESASQQCELIGDDLTRIDASLDVIDEAIASAGAATELVEAFLKSKNVDDTTIGGMAVARDMLSPERIKALMDAVAAAKAGLRATKEALDAMNDAAAEALNGADGSVVNGR